MLSAAIKVKIIAKLLAAVAVGVVKWALNKFAQWAASLIGDELASRLLAAFYAPSKKPWGNSSQGGVHTKYVSGTGFGGYVTFQWSGS